MKATTFSFAPRTSYGAVLHLSLSIHELEMLARLITTMDPQDQADRGIINTLLQATLAGHRTAIAAQEADHKAGLDNPNSNRSW